MQWNERTMLLRAYISLWRAFIFNQIHFLVGYFTSKSNVDCTSWAELFLRCHLHRHQIDVQRELHAANSDPLHALICTFRLFLVASCVLIVVAAFHCYLKKSP